MEDRHTTRLLANVVEIPLLRPQMGLGAAVLNPTDLAPTTAAEETLLGIMAPTQAVADN